MNKIKKTPSHKKAVIKKLDQDAQRVAAYYHWLQRGSPLGDDMTDWASAENDIERQETGEVGGEDQKEEDWEESDDEFNREDVKHQLRQDDRNEP